MFKWKYNSKFEFYLELTEGEFLPFKDWSNIQSHYLSQFSIIQELIDNGLAKTTDTTVELETEDIFSLSDIDKRLLGLPSDYPYVIYIESDGILSQNSFKFKYGYFDFVPNGNRLFFQKNEVLLTNDYTQYLLSLNQYKVLQAIERFNSLPESSRTFRSNLTCFADIKSLSDDVATLLDGYLQTENVLHPEKIKIDVLFNDEVLELRPKIEELSQDSLEKVFDLNNSIKSVYNVASIDGNKTRVIIDDEQIAELSKLKLNRKISDVDFIEKIVDNPQD